MGWLKKTEGTLRFKARGLRKFKSQLARTDKAVTAYYYDITFWKRVLRGEPSKKADTALREIDRLLDMMENGYEVEVDKKGTGRKK